MQAAPIPANDAERLQALRELLILDTPPEERFDKIARFAAEEFEVPTALVSLVDEQRQWFKARVGFPLCESPRETSFCGHAILQDDLLIIEDALLDPRFADNPLVIAEPFVRFYAGAPLRLPGGAAVGTLCLLDSKPGRLDVYGRAILGTLRDLVVEELLRRGEGSA
jgi:GAF domain-containing protein